MTDRHSNEPTSHDLAALLGSRICHDLTSPIGAIGNGIELLELNGEVNSPELELVSRSMAAARARLRLVRLTFGSAVPGQMVGAAEIVQTCADLEAVSRLEVEWEVRAEAERCAVKLALLLLQCLESAMPYGGKAHVATLNGAWKIEAKAPRKKDLPELWEALERLEVATDITAPLVHFALAAQTARALGRTLSVTRHETGISIAF